MASVLIVDDHELLAATLRLALRAAGLDAETLPPAPLPAIFDAVLERRPDLLLLDLELGGHGDTTPLIAPLTDLGVRVVVLTGLDDRLRIAAALEGGAAGRLSKSDGLDKVLNAVSQALATAGPLDAEEHVRLLDELRRARRLRSRTLEPFARLTEREQQTLRALAAGRAVREIADDWVVSETTIRSHVRTILAKLGAHSQLAAVAMGIRSGWFEVPLAAVE